MARSRQRGSARTLDLAEGIAIPAEAAARAFAVLATRGAGKSNLGAVLAEQLFAAGVPWVVVDPKGDYWGLRSSADGSGPGLPVPIFGGLHGDMPLDERSGALLAELVVDRNLSCILDVSDFPSKAAQARFLTDFAERIFRLHGRKPTVRHLVLEEADEIVPQRVMANMARCVGAWSKLVKQGRQRGLGVTLISQRSAVVNKDALSQVDTLIPLRTTSPQDRKAILGWVDYHAVGRDLVDSLPGLGDGEGWVISPHLLGVIERVRFRRRRTFDSGATPTLGAASEPATLADIDVGALRSEMTAVIEEAEANDPKALRRRVAALEAELARVQRDRPVATPERVEVPVPDPVTVQALAAAEETIADLRSVLAGQADTLTAAASVSRQAAEHTRPGRPARPLPERAPRSHQPPPASPLQTQRPRPPAEPPPRPATPAPAGPGALPKAQRSILTVLAQHPAGRTKRQLAMQAGYSAGGGGFNNALSALRTAGLIDPAKGDPIRATDAGVDALGGDWEPLPVGRALLDHWLAQVGKAERLVLEALAEVWPAALTKEQLADATGYAANGGGFNNALSRLRTLQLIDGRGELTLDATLGEASAH